MPEHLTDIFPNTVRNLGSRLSQEVFALLDGIPPEDVPAKLFELSSACEMPAYLADLARAELARHRVACSNPAALPIAVDELSLNPSLQLVDVGWRKLLALLEGDDSAPQPGQQFLVFWRHPVSGEPCQSTASPTDLLALKVVAEQLDPLEVAKTSDKPVGVIDDAVDRAASKGLLLRPPSKIRRDPQDFPLPDDALPQFVVADAFTLQWHITHRCDLHCRHCYDRSHRKDVSLAKGIDILDQTRQFCRDRHVSGQVSFSGGNPFMHPDFITLYRAAHERNLTPAILGNPVTGAELDAILAITRPVFYQVSLEGLEEHNDHIRGKGSFRAVIDFLDLLKQKQIYSMVMLTLTRANLDQVLPLSEVLRDRVDLFTYNRLAMVGEGAQLESPQPDEYRQFVRAYLEARRSNPIMALKDSLINIELEQGEQKLFGGCTCFGCGAAFNFVSLLPDGQVHACRKFPSPIGDINQHTLAQIYDSPAARRYRQGCRECADCHLRLVCGGCLAVTHGWGRDPFTEKDPDCFLK